MTDTITALHRNLCDAAQELTRAHAAALHEHGRDYDPARVAQPTAALASALVAWQRATLPPPSERLVDADRVAMARALADAHVYIEERSRIATLADVDSAPCLDADESLRACIALVTFAGETHRLRDAAVAAHASGDGSCVARIVDDVPRDADGAPVEHEVIAGMC